MDAELIEQAVDDSLGPMIGNESGWTFVAGLDLGISHDHAALVVVGVHHQESKIRLAYTRAWQPHRKTKEVNLQDVENVTLGVCRQFRTVQLRYDPYQAKLMAQRLTTRGVWCEECPFFGKNLMLMASSMIEVFRDAKFRMYRDERLIRRL